MKWVAIVAALLIVIVLVALQFEPRSQDPSLIGTWRSLDKDGWFLILRDDGYGFDSIDNNSPNLKTVRNLRWWTSSGTLNIEKWDEEGSSRKVGRMQYMLRRGTLTFVGEVPEQWSSVYSMKGKVPE